MISFLAAPSLNITASCGPLSTLKNELQQSHKKAFQDHQEMVHPIIGTRQHFLNGNSARYPVFPVSQEISSSSCQIFCRKLDSLCVRRAPVFTT